MIFINSILVFEQNGSRPTGFESLSNLVDHEGNEIVPIDVDIDKKMNVFIIDGSQRIFNWNQYWNEIGINFYKKYNMKFDEEWVNCYMEFDEK